MEGLDAASPGILNIPFIIVQILIFVIGLFIQLKTIYVCWKDREGKTWHIHMLHSIAVTIAFAFAISFRTVTQAIPNLSVYTGDWFCYLATFITIYGHVIITFNSLLIASMKYWFIIHHKKALEFGELKAIKAFFILDLTLPFVLAITSCLTTDIEQFSELVNCFGMTEQEEKQYNTSEKDMQKFFLCNLNMTDADISDEYTLYILKQCVCILKTVIIMAIQTNVAEAFLYYKIFRMMKR